MTTQKRRRRLRHHPLPLRGRRPHHRPRRDLAASVTA